MTKAKFFQGLIGLSIAGGLLFSSSSAEAFLFEEKVSTAKSVAHYAMGQVYDLLGLTNLAVLEYEKATQFDEAGHLLHLRLGAAYARLGLLAEATEELQLANKYHPQDLQSRYLLALIYSTQGNFEKAALEYETILTKFSEQDPGNIEIYEYLGQLYYSQSKFDQAIEQFEKILSIEPGNADVLFLLGSLYSETRQGERAIQLLEKSLEIDPEHDGSLNSLGYLYAEQGRNLDEAEAMIQKALEINPENGAYLDSLGWVYFKKEQYEKALEFLREADGLIEDSVVRDHLGDVYFKLNRLEEAVQYWEQSLELRPDQESVRAKIEGVQSIQARNEQRIQETY